MSTAVGIHAHPMFKLGWKPTPARFERLHLRNYLTGVVPAHPPAVDHLKASGLLFDLYGNGTFGDCGPAYVANLRRLVTFWLTGTLTAPTLNDVYDLYRRSGNPTFDPTTGAGDNGVDMGTMLTAVSTGGIGGVKCLAFAQVDPTDRAEMDAAVSLFGATGWGLDLRVAQQAQTNTGTWDYVPGSPEWGGHATLNGAYTEGAGEKEWNETWALDVAATDAFLQHQLQEVWVVVWPENLTYPAFQAGIDLTALAADWTAMTGQPVSWAPPTPTPTPTPTPVPPAPTPTPTPQPGALVAACEALASNSRAVTWLTGTRHHGEPPEIPGLISGILTALAAE